MKKITSILSIVLLVALCVSTYSYAGPINKWYYENHPTTLQDAKSVYGDPVHSQELADGTQKVVFASIKSGMDLGSPYLIVKDGKVLDGGIGVAYVKPNAIQVQCDALKVQIAGIEARVKELEKKDQ